MAGSAILGDNLIDDLAPDIDELRTDLYADFGVTSFNFQLIKRTWLGSSGLEGDGDYHDETITLEPPPKIQQWDGYKWVLLAAGYHEDGEIRVSKVSLTYTWNELTGGDLAKNQQFFYRLVDAHGQGQKDRLLRQSRPPQVIRDSKTLIPGWVMWLMDMNISRTAPVEVTP